jgi:hypothetical protein
MPGPGNHNQPTPEKEIRDRTDANLESGPGAWREKIKALIENLHNPDANVRRLAAQALGGIGLKASAAVPSLIRALRDDTIR